MARDDAAAQLEHLQSFHLQSINNSLGRKNRKHDKHSTTSLQDLDLARTPVDKDRPHASRRPWAQPDTEVITDEASSCSPQPEQRSGEEAGRTDLHQTQKSQFTRSTRQHRWARRVDMRDEQEVCSNAWGSARPSEATRDSNVCDGIFGRLLNKRPADANESGLANWVGEWTPAPEDWERRTRFNNNNEDYKLAFQNWIEERAKPVLLSDDLEYCKIPHEVLLQYDYIADGIEMVPNTVTVNRTNAVKYGFLTTTDPQDGPGKYTNILEPFELQDSVRLHPSGRESFKYSLETTESLVQNWLRHKSLVDAIDQRRNDTPQQVMAMPSPVRYNLNPGLIPAQIPLVTVSKSPAAALGGDALTPAALGSLPSSRPQLNIYMRPAEERDIQELVRIYNWYVENTPRPCETTPISDNDMGQRLDRCQESRLPFIVAVKRKQRGPSGLSEEQRHGQRIVRVEQLTGFVSVCDYTCKDYVEHITGELEVYVDPSCLRMGVGTSLLDKAFEVCDNAYQRKQDTYFTCAPESRHLYGPGGGRQIHKLVVLLRKWKHPNMSASNARNHDKRKPRGSRSTKTSEDEYERWLRRWLQDCGFKLEGVLKSVGAKNGRYIDIAMLGREMSWAPDEGNVPEPWVGYGPRVNGNSTNGY